MKYRGLASHLKAWLHLLQNGRCILCGEAIHLELPRGAYGAPTFEHLNPRTKGGTDSRYNLGLSHAECNHHRGTRLTLKFVRPEQSPIALEPGYRTLVPFPGIWHSHFKLPIWDPRWERSHEHN